MRTTWVEGDTRTRLRNDPLGSAARLRRARLDPDALGPRVLHVAVDAVALVLLLAVPTLAALVAVTLDPAPGTEPLVPAVAVAVATLAVLVGFTVLWPHHDGGRTAGMRWAGLRVVDRTGRPPSAWQLALRAATMPVDLVLGPVLVLARRDRRRLGDLLAGTQVVRDLSAPPPAGRPRAARAPRPRSASTSAWTAPPR